MMKKPTDRGNKILLHWEQWKLVILDILFLTGSILLAYFIQYQFSPEQEVIDQCLHLIPALIIIQFSIFLFFGIYRTIWKYSGIADLLLIIQATMVMGLLAFLFQVSLRTYLVSPRLMEMMDFIVRPVLGIIFLGMEMPKLEFPYSLILLYWFISILLIGGERLLARYWVELKRREQTDSVKRLLIIGGGDESETILRELRRNPYLPFIPIGILDENTDRLGLQIHGVKIIGAIDDISHIIKEYQIDEILIALPSHSGKIIRRILAYCEQSKLKIRTLPAMEAFLAGKIQINQFPEIQPEDLLGREEVHINTAEVAKYLTGQRILITGAGGSIGSELCRQVAEFDPEQIILLGSGENSIYDIEVELHHLHPKSNIIPVIANIQDFDRIKNIFQIYQPQVVFHAAAHKHVPLMEINPGESIKNNIFGTLIIAQNAIQYHVRRFIFISTDKAIRPSNMMGLSKRIAELVIECQANSNKDTKFSIVRFGNVLGSRGSVVPLFQKQIQWGGPLTITHPDTTRYFMSVREAVKLVIQTGVIGQSGDLFALNMGEPVKILELARNLISLSGLEPDDDIQIQFTGLRQGEKLTEESVTLGAGIQHTNYLNIYQMPSDILDCHLLEQRLIQLKEFIKNHHSTTEYINELNRLIQDTVQSP